MIRRALLLGVLCILLAGSSVSAQVLLTPTYTADTVDASLLKTQAASSHVTFLASLTDDKMRLFGYRDSLQAMSTMLGVPWAEKAIWLQPLKAYSGDTTGLMTGFHRVIYPVANGDTTLSSLAMKKLAAGSWKAIQYGESTLAPLVDSMRKAKAQAMATIPDNFYVIRVPALNRVFLAYNTVTEFRMVALYTDMKLVLVRGDDRPAHEILTKLQHLASLHDGRPR